MCPNGSTQRSYIPKEEVSSPMVTTESMLTNSVIDAKQEREVVAMGIPNAFTQTKVPQGDIRIVMKSRGALAHMLLEIDPENKQTS